ncbi:MAG: CotH kinase family protein [Phycisphaerales bacterium]|nr:CotH kinase family protein [Phycisphaerales bacterium]
MGRLLLAVGLLVCAGAGAVRGQDLYDTTVLRTFAFEFHDADWLSRLRANYASQTNILADLTVDGVTYPSVGVRIRGNTSYTGLPAGSEKFSLNVEVDFVHPDQDVLGYDSLNLNNAFRDPTFCREVLYNNYVAQFIPNGRANHVVVTLNGQNWGVYVNVQQFDKKMLSGWFPDTNGLRIKCANNPNGPGLRYNGALPSGYTGYEIKNDGGLADPWGALIAVCNSLTNEPLATWQNIDSLFAIDPSIWSVVLENILTDDDSYVNKGADFVTYRNPTDGRTFLLQTDANETFTQSSWLITRNFTATTKPVLNRVLAVAELRQRYMAHYRTVKADLTLEYWEPKATALRNLIDAAVQADPKKLYTYAQFQSNFTNTVTLSGAGPSGGSVPGLLAFVTARATFLNSNAELTANGPTISSVLASNLAPDPSEPVSVTALVTPNGSAISKVELFYRPAPTGRYQRVLMTAAGGGQYTAPLPVAATPGQRVPFYVAATAANANLSLSFLPKRTEWDPIVVSYTFGSEGGMRITEWMYSGASGEFIELTNRSQDPIDMNGWSLDDDHAQPGAFDLSAFGVVQPGESVIMTEAAETTFRAAWALPASVKVIGGLGGAAAGGNNLGRNDEINVYGADDLLVDRLTFGDQTYPGTIRAQNFSGQTCREAIGQDDVSAWVRSAIGDSFGSHASSTGDVGTPGSYAAPTCAACVAPEVVTNPEGLSVCVGSPVSFSVIATGTGPLAYQWQVEAEPAGSGVFVNLAEGPLAGVGTVSGSTSASLSLTELTPGGAATVRCLVSNACGGDESAAASLAVRAGVAGDMNCDGMFNNFDIDPFVLAIVDAAAYAAEFPDCDPILGDVNCDGVFNNFDIDPFVACLVNGCP